MSNAVRSGFHTHFGSLIGQVVSAVSYHVRKKMYFQFSKRFLNEKAILDVGVTSDNVAPEANYFETLHPYKDRITAVGIEDASHLQDQYPGLKFVKVVPNQKLPFGDSAYDVAFSNAVIEHIVNDKDRIDFIIELLRVAKKAFITTPNRYFPIEPHTGFPLLHMFFPKLFYNLLDQGKISNFYNSSNLKLLTKKELVEIGNRINVRYEIIPVFFCGFVSNWIIIFHKNED